MSETHSLEDIRTALVSLRQEPKTKKRFPKEIWDSIIQLTKSHSIEEICQSLQINPVYLKRKIFQSQPKPQVDFHEIPMQNHSFDMVTIELNSQSGLHVKIQGPMSCLSYLNQLFKV